MVLALAAAAMLAGVLVALDPPHEEARGWLRLLLTLLVLVALAKAYDLYRGRAEERYRRLFEEVAAHVAGTLSTAPREATRSRGRLGEGTTTLLTLAWQQDGYSLRWSFERRRKGRTHNDVFPLHVACRNPQRMAWAIRQEGIYRRQIAQREDRLTGDREFEKRFVVTADSDGTVACLLPPTVRDRLRALFPLLRFDIESHDRGLVATLYQPPGDLYPYPYLFDLLTDLAGRMENPSPDRA
ncbi:MAG: hypothetical protein PVF51_02530 [Nitrospirota bacterium]|jgi:hypothetical protein